MFFDFIDVAAGRSGGPLHCINRYTTIVLTKFLPTCHNWLILAWCWLQHSIDTECFSFGKKGSKTKNIYEFPIVFDQICEYFVRAYLSVWSINQSTVCKLSATHWENTQQKIYLSRKRILFMAITNQSHDTCGVFNLFKAFKTRFCVSK